MPQTLFGFHEILSAIGMAQCVMILVYMVFRAGDKLRALIPILYFLALGLAFFLDFSERFIGTATDLWPVLQWLAWSSGPPLSVLLVLQIARLSEPPSWSDSLLLLTIPVALGAAGLLSMTGEACQLSALLTACQDFGKWRVVTGLAAGAISLLVLWLKRGVLSGIAAQKNGRERYWLALCLIVINVLLLATMLLSLGDWGTPRDFLSVRTILGMGLAYLAGTSLLRIYPTAVRLASEPSALDPAELAIARQIERLMDFDKVYQEAAYSRADLARELGSTEAAVSRVINVYFQKTFPQLLNERRVADAKRLLGDTDAAIRIVAEEVGFNSLATFNRVFRDIAGTNPGTYRQDVRSEGKAKVPKVS